MPIFAFIIGTCFGSFANVIMTRLNALSLLSRSKCLSCGHRISNWDNIPIVSYMLLRGKCRHCKSKFSSRYMWVELGMGVLGYMIWIKVGDNPNLYLAILHYLLDLILFTILLAISQYDYRHKIVPTQLSIALMIDALLQIALRLYDHSDQFGLLTNTLSYNALLELGGGVLAAAPYALLFIISRGRWVGFGDVIVYAGVGWALGLVNAVYIILYSIWIGGLFTIVWHAIEKKRNYLKMEIPFAPFIALAALIVYIYNSDILGIHNIVMFGF